MVLFRPTTAIRTLSRGFHLHHKFLNSVMEISGSDRIRGLEKSVWVEFTGLAVQHNAVNVGQGFPDFAAPEHARKALADVALGTWNVHQYTRGFGHMRLVNCLGRLYSDLLKTHINPLTDILITAGAYNALFYSIFGYINSGDEVIIIEPFYDCYDPVVRMAGGVPVFVTLKPPKQKEDAKSISSGDFVLDMREFENAITPRTKMIILNNPNNPLGKVYTRAELEGIADVVRRHPSIVVISDEVYEWLTYKPNEMIRFASIADMYDRTITVGSIGKTFSVTGWKTGWTIAPQKLIKHLQTIHQNCIFTCPTPLQEAAALSFEHEMNQSTENSYFAQLPNQLLPKRERMANFLEEAGMQPIIPDGGYFMMADYTKLGNTVRLTANADEPKDYTFVKWLCKEKKLAAIPSSAFYHNKELGEHYIRFCFFKDDKTLEAAEDIIRKWHH